MRRALALLLRRLDDAIAARHIGRCQRARDQLAMLEGWWAL